MSEVVKSATDLNRLGADLWLQGDLDGAAAHYLAALRSDSDYVPAVANMACVLSERSQLAATELAWRRALALAPGRADFMGALGCALYRRERYAEARVRIEKACALAPDDPNGWYNLGLLECRERRYSEALAALDRVESLGIRTPAIENDRAHMLLALGDDLSSALALYEARWDTLAHLPPWDHYIPEWQGESLAGRRILAHAEQGFGDTLMCVRFIHRLIAMGADVTLAVQEPLVRLFELQHWLDIKVVDLWALPSDARNQFDYHTPLMSMLRWLGIQQADIDSQPYLITPACYGPAAEGPKFNVGICWASGQRHTEVDWRRRHAPLDLWLRLLEIPGVDFWSLQIDEAKAEIETLGLEMFIHDTSAELKDFAATAVLVASLDLVIAVDTAVAHLAAALGRPTIMLSQYSNCWRWWDIDFERGSPWYDSMTIFRQPTPGDWRRPLAKCELALSIAIGRRREALAA